MHTIRGATRVRARPGTRPARFPAIVFDRQDRRRLAPLSLLAIVLVAGIGFVMAEGAPVVGDLTSAPPSAQPVASPAVAPPSPATEAVTPSPGSGSASIARAEPAPAVDSPERAIDEAGKRMILVAPGSDAAAGPPPAPPTEVGAEDKPGDEGKRIHVHWTVSKDDGSGAKSVVGYEILRATSAEGPFEATETKAPAGKSSADDETPADGTDYYYMVRAMSANSSSDSSPTGPARSSPQWYRPALTIVLVTTVLFCAVCLLVLSRAGRGDKIYIRPIGGINAIDEAIGRATEMGKPILFLCGLNEASDVPTIAAFSILARVAKKVAEYQSRLIVPCRYSMVMVVAQEVVKNAYAAAGRPDAYRERDVFFITQEQFAYVAAVNGIMLRERPATNFYLGAFFAESLVLAETGFHAGSIQIAGTDQPIQIPFFVAACDYTLIGEELYAAAAYLSDDPKQKATLKAQDYGKANVLAVLAIGALLLATVPRLGTWLVRAFEIQFDRAYSASDILGTVLVGAALAAGTALFLWAGRVLARSTGSRAS